MTVTHKHVSFYCIWFRG